jgi:hypothetical protein
MNESWLEIDTSEGSDDWLDTSPPSLPSAKELVELTPSIPPDLELPADPKKRNKLIKEAWGRLNPRQQAVLYALPANRFNMRKTVRELEPTINKVSQRAVEDWSAGNEDFRLIFRVMRGVAAEAATNPDRLHLMVNDIAEAAIEGEEILFQGQPTGFKKRQFSDALRAIELQMKAKNMLRGDDNTARVKVQIVRMTGDWESGETIEGDSVVVDTSEEVSSDFLS